MAKKKKPSEKQAFLAKQRKEQRQAVSRAAKKKKHRKKLIITTISCAAAAGLIIGGTVWAVKTKPLRHYIPVEKTEHYSLNAAEISFYSWQIYQSYLENSSGSTDTFDTNKPLSEQDYDEDTTWEEYFTDAAREYAQNILTFCEASYAEGYEAAEDIPVIAKSCLDEFNSETFPKGVTDEDVVHAMELYLMAWDFNTEKQNSMTLTDDELNDYYETNPKTMQVCTYMSFSFAFDDSDETATQRSEADELARELRRCDTRESFESWVYTYYKENTSLTEEELQSQVSTLCTEDAAYTEGDALSEWAFSGEAKAGDTTIVTDEENSALTVYLLLSEPERDETYPVKLRQILFTSDTYESTDGAHSAAESAMKEWESGDQTEERFAELANQYSEDTSTDGGLYTEVTKAQMLPNWKEWCFDPARQAGDVTILGSSYGSCLVYYVGASEQPGWKLTATEAMSTEKYNELCESYADQADVSTRDWMMRFVHVNDKS
ncbi:peptidylprolyl isomerase [Ruminococcus sp.]|uniref:foldase protein PrsA n=1 Tax=Ruminococcus sp. TaxID=41978 RepID=UPI0025E57059|nr:peptidylprolyl isomerase [Ruminococcus sp.]